MHNHSVYLMTRKTMVGFPLFFVSSILLLLSACASSSPNKAADVAVDRSATIGLTDQQIELAGFTESTINSRELLGYRPLKRVLVTLAGEDQLARPTEYRS